MRLASVAPTHGLGFAGVLLLLAAAPAAAQNELMTRCAALPDANSQWFCLSLAQGATIAQPRFGIAAAGANPLPGSASTLGMRMGSSPRISLDVRFTGTRMTVPSLAPSSSSAAAGSADAWGQSSAFASGIALDAGLGVLSGASPAPTVGGMGSLDLFASAGLIDNAGHGFQGGTWSGAVGARLGVLRESFTVPGITLSGAYRRTGHVDFGEATRPLGGYQLGPTSDLSLRAVAGKRLFFLNTAVGAGLDRYSSDVQETRSCPPDVLDCALSYATFNVSGPLTQTRANAFGELTWTSLVVNVTADLGWQRGGSAPNAATWTPTGYEDLVRKGALFGSLAVRLTI